MKVNFKNIFLIFSILFSFSLKAQKKDGKSFYGPNKKEFKSEEYQALKDEVNLIDQMEKKELHEDSSQFGVGYGVEKGDRYVIYTFDSLNNNGYYSEKHRGSGVRDAKDGVQPSARESFQKKEFQRRSAQERRKNKKRKVRERELNKAKQESFRDRPRNEKAKQNELSHKGMKFLLIILIAFILGASAYVLFVKSPIKGLDKKILYEQEMNPDAINLSDLETKIKFAKESNNLRLATRLYFVWIIKELADNNHIQWKKRKTNYHYQSEVEGKIFAEEFKKSIKNYEFIWYGKYDILFDEFKSIEISFKALISKINSK